ncbi:MAG: GNAT family N-acetyltransferase [Pseudomonadota bacterium]
MFSSPLEDRVRLTTCTTKPLTEATWPDYAKLIEANNGVWGGCWCLWYHGKAYSDASYDQKRDEKRSRVSEGRAHAALVYSGSDCVGWCQFGSPLELPRIHNQRAYEKASSGLPDWRITCFFSGKGHRGNGVANAALLGALDQIKALGGGHVEGYPEDVENRKASSAFLFNGALHMFERAGFERSRQIGKHKWVVTLTV